MSLNDLNALSDHAVALLVLAMFLGSMVVIRVAGALASCFSQQREIDYLRTEVRRMADRQASQQVPEVRS